MTKFLEILIVEPSQDGNIGILLIDGEGFCWTMARDYNDKGYSIPLGLHDYEAYDSPTYGPTFQIMVEGHTALLFHWLNTEDESTGCIGLGERPGKLNRKRSVLVSRVTFYAFMVKMRGVTHGKLRIRMA